MFDSIRENIDADQFIGQYYSERMLAKFKPNLVRKTKRRNVSQNFNNPLRYNVESLAKKTKNLKNQAKN